MQKLLSAFAFVLALAIGGSMLFQQRELQSARGRLQILQQELETQRSALTALKQTPTPPVQAASSSHVSSLADAILLLPHPEQAVAGEKIREGMYWVWTKEVHHDEENKSEDQSWIVNLSTREAKLLRSHVFDVPYGPRVGYEQSTQNYFIIDWTAGWEGTSLEIKEVIDRATGASYALSLRDGFLATIEEEGRKLDITLDPVNGCARAFHDPHLRVEVKALNVNGVSRPLPQSQMVQCLVNEIAGVGIYPAFQGLFFSDEGVARLILPWSGTVDIPLPRLDPARIRIQR